MYKCYLCDLESTRKSTIIRHQNDIHLNIKRFQCTSCPLQFSRKFVLDRHVSRLHLGLREHICIECNSRFGTKDCLIRHKLCCNGNGRQISKLEKAVFKALDDLGFVENEDFVFNRHFTELTEYSGRFLRPDFRFLKHKIFLEADGRQHFEPVRFGGISQSRAEANLVKTKESDRVTNKFCAENGWKMIRIDYKQFPKILEILHNGLMEIVEW